MFHVVLHCPEIPPNAGNAIRLTANSGVRDDLAAPDTLGPGLHHFAISWDRARQSKALYLDGQRANAINGAELPADVGPMLDLGRRAQGSSARDVVFDELVIYDLSLIHI